MMKALVVVATFVAQLGFAALPQPGNKDVSVVTVSGESAKKLTQLIQRDPSTRTFPGDALRTQWSNWIVLRTSNGLKQTVCLAVTRRLVGTDTTYSCTVTTSLNGRPVPPFKAPPRRLG